MSARKDRLIWIDLEMTGLSPSSDRIIEIATIVTDYQLNTVSEGPVIAIHQSESYLQAMDEWNVSHHTQSGLIERVRQSEENEDSATQRTLEFLQQHVAAGCSPMCGNTICQDRRFLARTMPELEQYFHYRQLDVSSIKIIAQHWYPEISAQYHKVSKHQALDDIRDSIDELKFYRENLFLPVNLNQPIDS